MENYELAYRILLLISASSPDRHEGSDINPDMIHKILGADKDTVDSVVKTLIADRLLFISGDKVFIG